MKAHLPTLLVALLAPLLLAPAGAQPTSVNGVLVPPIQGPGSGSLYPSGSGSLYPTPIPRQSGLFGSGGGHHGHGYHGGGTVLLLGDREVVHDVVVVHDVAAEPPAPPPPPPKPREPWVLGKTYASLPDGCMKMVEGGASYYRCSGDWYRMVAGGYRAVEAP